MLPSCFACKFSFQPAKVVIESGKPITQSGKKGKRVVIFYRKKDGIRWLKRL
jgi:hypothetical protein